MNMQDKNKAPMRQLNTGIVTDRIHLYFDYSKTGTDVTLGSGLFKTELEMSPTFSSMKNIEQQDPSMNNYHFSIMALEEGLTLLLANAKTIKFTTLVLYNQNALIFDWLQYLNFSTSYQEQFAKVLPLLAQLIEMSIEIDFTQIEGKNNKIKRLFKAKPPGMRKPQSKTLDLSYLAQLTTQAKDIRVKQEKEEQSNVVNFKQSSAY
jgi:hypothetical protein